MCPAQFSFLSRHYPIISYSPMKEAGFETTSLKIDQSQLCIFPLFNQPTKPELASIQEEVRLATARLAKNLY